MLVFASVLFMSNILIEIFPLNIFSFTFYLLIVFSLILPTVKHNAASL